MYECCVYKTSRSKTQKPRIDSTDSALRQHCIKEQSAAFSFLINIIVILRDGCCYYAAMHFLIANENGVGERNETQKSNVKFQRRSKKITSRRKKNPQ